VQHITLPEGLPGIRGPLAFRPETAKPLNELVEVLLHDRNHPLTPCERELIATYVSSRNDCYYGQTVHGAIAAAQLNDNEELVQQVRRDFTSAPISEKLKALLVIAGKVQQGGKSVTAGDVERARQQGASDLEIHDTVLIAAAFCMYNRYVDGLATFAPQDPEFYRQRWAPGSRSRLCRSESRTRCNCLAIVEPIESCTHLLRTIFGATP
jgi:uncharacterized peroxidase-related enzyme